ncbi:MAG: hypothetical protein JNL98_06940 [Bryobacterales bacterium]|nr:hypothetical protein [Bryobacterales bacterium]
MLLRSDFKALLDSGGARILQPDVIHCGGITEMRRIAALGELYDVEISPHMWYGPIAHAASIHSMAAVRNFLAQDWDGGSEALFADITHGTLLKQQQGGVMLPEKPGLGIEMDWELLKCRFPYQGRRATPQITPRPQAR